MSSDQNEEDNIITLILLFCGVGGFGLFSLTALLAPVQVWMVEQGILVAGQSVLIGWGEDLVGLDLPRVIVAAGVILLLVVLLVTVIRKRWSRRDV
jgi:hypothetical protein